MVVVAVYVMMALGLNMVVGYAGLLDLGYVAFFAIGAYCAAWFASPHFAVPEHPTRRAEDRHRLRRGRRVPEGVGGIHISIWLVLLIGAAITAVAGVLDRLAHAALARRLPRHRHPRLRRDGGAGRPQRRRVQPGLQPHERPAGHQPRRLARASAAGSTSTVGLPGMSSAMRSAGGSGRTVDSVGDFVDLMYWGAIGLVLVTLFCSIRLRDSRLGRAWIAIREDETAAAAMGVPLMRTKTWSYRVGSVLRRRRRGVVRVLPAGGVPRHVQLQRLGVHPLHGHPRRHGQRLGRDRGRRLPRLPQHGGPRGVRRLDERERPALRRRARRPAR